VRRRFADIDDTRSARLAELDGNDVDLALPVSEEAVVCDDGALLDVPQVRADEAFADVAVAYG
jgi:hypothetical protein